MLSSCAIDIVQIEVAPEFLEATRPLLDALARCGVERPSLTFDMGMTKDLGS